MWVLLKTIWKQQKLEDMERFVNVIGYAEIMAKLHIPMTMVGWAKRIDIILEAGEDAGFTDAGIITAKFAKSE